MMKVLSGVESCENERVIFTLSFLSRHDLPEFRLQAGSYHAWLWHAF